MDYSKHYFRNSDHVMVLFWVGFRTRIGFGKTLGGLEPVRGFVLFPVREALSQPSTRLFGEFVKLLYL